MSTIASGERLSWAFGPPCTLLGQAPAPPPGPVESVAALLQRLTGVDLTACPVCRAGHLRIVAVFRPGARPVLIVDTS